MHAGGDEELGELAGAVSPCQDRSYESWPEGLAAVSTRGQCSGRGGCESIADGAAEARPEEICVVLRCGRGRWRWGYGKNLYEFLFGVVRELDMWCEGGAQKEGIWCGDDEDTRQAWYLGGMLACA